MLRRGGEAHPRPPVCSLVTCPSLSQMPNRRLATGVGPHVRTEKDAGMTFSQASWPRCRPAGQGEDRCAHPADARRGLDALRRTDRAPRVEAIEATSAWSSSGELMK